MKKFLGLIFIATTIAIIAKLAYEVLPILIGERYIESDN